MTTYQLFDTLDPAIEAALRASIKRWGVLVPIVIDQHGDVIDGHHRKRIADELGVDCPEWAHPVSDADEARELARTLNVDRRHLDPDQRRLVVADLRQQGHSLRAIAGAVGSSKSQVERDVDELSRTGQSVQPERVTRQGGGTYPATRPEPGPASAPMPEPKLEWKPAKPDLGNGISHPARFSPELIDEFRGLLHKHHVPAGARVLDPFAGPGGIHELHPEFDTVGVEIQKQWADLHERTLTGDAHDLVGLFDVDTFDAIVTSPTYGNRLADSHNASDPERRRSYTHDLGGDLEPNNSGAMHWRNGTQGSVAYRTFHDKAWGEAALVLKPGGLFILNIKDHIRSGQLMPVSNWHSWCLGRLGLDYVDSLSVPASDLRQGTNGDLRHSFELVLVFGKPS